MTQRQESRFRVPEVIDEESLGRFIENRMSSEEADSFRSSLSSCPEFGAKVDRLQTTHKMLHSLVKRQGIPSEYYGLISRLQNPNSQAIEDMRNAEPFQSELTKGSDVPFIGPAGLRKKVNDLEIFGRVFGGAVRRPEVGKPPSQFYDLVLKAKNRPSLVTKSETEIKEQKRNQSIEEKPPVQSKSFDYLRSRLLTMAPNRRFKSPATTAGKRLSPERRIGRWLFGGSRFRKRRAQLDDFFDILISGEKSYEGHEKLAMASLLGLLTTEAHATDFRDQKYLLRKYMAYRRKHNKRSSDFGGLCDKLFDLIYEQVVLRGQPIRREIIKEKFLKKYLDPLELQLLEIVPTLEQRVGALGLSVHFAYLRNALCNLVANKHDLSPKAGITLKAQASSLIWAEIEAFANDYRSAEKPNFKNGNIANRISDLIVLGTCFGISPRHTYMASWEVKLFTLSIRDHVTYKHLTLEEIRNDSKLYFRSIWRLPPDIREAKFLRLEGLNIEEIANELIASTSMVRSYLTEANRLLQGCPIMSLGLFEKDDLLSQEDRPGKMSGGGLIA